MRFPLSVTTYKTTTAVTRSERVRLKDKKKERQGQIKCGPEKEARRDVQKTFLPDETSLFFQGRS